MSVIVKVGKVALGANRPLVLIAGPCVIESRAHCRQMARGLVTLAQRERIPLIFKASYDKANRTSHTSYRGPGLDKGLKILAEIKDEYGVPVLTDVHEPADVPRAAAVADMLQIPAFLCRQTDLALAAGESGCAVNVKKGQFMAPWDIAHVVAKIESTGNRRIVLTERGTSFGYNNLVADMRSLLVMAELGYPVIFDATHSVQLPGGEGQQSGGDARWAPPLARAAVATGCHGVFLETHTRPDRALSDPASMLPLRSVGKLWRQLTAIDQTVRGKGGGR